MPLTRSARRGTAAVALGALLLLPLAARAASPSPPTTPTTPPEIVAAAQDFADQLGGTLSFLTTTKWKIGGEEAYVAGVEAKSPPSSVRPQSDMTLVEGLKPQVTIYCKTISTGTSATGECITAR